MNTNPKITGPIMCPRCGRDSIAQVVAPPLNIWYCCTCDWVGGGANLFTGANLLKVLVFAKAEDESKDTESWVR